MNTAVLSGITLVVPTRNRPILLGRLLDYWENHMPALTILVADSGDEDGYEANRVICGNPSKHRRLHLRYQEGISFIDKVAAAVATVRSPFVALCADDDFILPGSLETAVRLLSEQEDIACVQGLEIFFRPATSLGQPGRLLLDVHANPSVDQSTAGLRLMSHLGHYRASMYGVRRTAELLEDVQAMIPLQEQYMLMELAFASMDAIRGKLIRLPGIMTMRESHPAVTYKSQPEQTQWDHVLFDPEFSKWLSIYLAIIVPRFAQASGLSSDAARRSVIDSLRAYSKAYFSSMDLANAAQDNILERLKRTLFEMPILGVWFRQLWRKITLAYDKNRVLKRHSRAFQEPNYQALIRQINRHCGFADAESILR